jgi:hypothetical protein
VSATTVLELVILALGVLALVLGLAWLGRRPARWDAAIAEHYAVTGDYPTVGEWRSGRVGRDAARPDPSAAPAGPVTVTVTAVDGKPVGGAR